MNLSRKKQIVVAPWLIVLSGLLLLIGLPSAVSLGQAEQDNRVFQSGTVTDCKVHQSAPKTDDDAEKYDLSIRVGNKIYVVLYSPARGQSMAKYLVHKSFNVYIDGNTMLANNLLGETKRMPILSSKDAPPPADK